MLSGMLAFEWRYLTRRLAFAGVTLVLALLAWAMVATGYGGAAVRSNSPYSVMLAFSMLSLWLVFTQTMFVVNGVLRDDEHGMRELVFSKPVARWQFVASRLGGPVLAGMTVMVLTAVVLMVTPFILSLAPARVGPLRMAPYLLPLATLILPNLLLVTAVLFAVATFTRSTMATYVGGIIVFGVYMTTVVLVDSPLLASAAPATPELLARAAILDPFGVSAFFEQVRYWTPAERNVRLLSVSGHYLWNRVLWVSVAAAIVAFTSRAAPWERMGTRRVPRRAARAAEGEVGTPPGVTYAPVVPATHAFWGALRSQLTLELRLLFGARATQVLLAVWAVIAFTETQGALISGEYGTRLVATSGALAASANDALFLLGLLCVAYYAASVVWRDRLVRVDGITDATPTLNGVFFLAQLAALCALPVALTAVALIAALSVHLSSLHLAIQPSVYLAQFWFAALPLCLFAVAAIALQVLTPNRWIGALATLLLGVTSRVVQPEWMAHPMMRFAAAPSVAWSDLDGFGPATASFAAFMGYWFAWALLLGVITWGAWQRGVALGVARRVRAEFAVRSRRRYALAAAGLLVVVCGVALIVQTNVAHAWESRSAQIARRVAYERQYRRLDGQMVPQVTAVVLAVDLHPARRQAQVRGTLTIENQGSAAIDTFWVALRRDVSATDIQVANARVVERDVRHGMWVIVPAEALAPQATTTLSYELAIDRGGVRADGFSIDVAANGGYLTITEVMPVFGYRRGNEVREPVVRKQFGLGPSSDEAQMVTPALAWHTLDLTVSTSADQTALAPGALVRSWSAGDRRFFQYRVTEPMTPGFVIASARYAKRHVEHNGVTVEFWYHPTHDRNVSRMIDAATLSLDVYGAEFGRYPREVLRMVEVPAGWPFGGYAMSGLLAFTENRGMLTYERAPDVDLVARRVAHEVSHQWWGHAVRPLPGAGATTIIETLAKHAERLVIERLHGDSAVTAMLAFEHDGYLASRAGEAQREPTLLTVRDEAYVYYGKGALAMHALSVALGDSAINRALAGVVRGASGPDGKATARFLYEGIRAEARDAAARRLVDEWFTQRVIYDVALDSAFARPVAGGSRVHAALTVRRETTDDDGREQVAPADAMTLEVAVYGVGAASSQVLWRGVTVVSHGRARVDVTVPTRAGAVEIDPRYLRIDRDRSDNRRRVDR